MSEWVVKNLDEVVEYFIDYRGKTPDKKDSGIPLITAKIVKDGRLDTATEFISVEDYPLWMTRGYPEVNDVVLTTEAPLGEVALIKNKNVALAQRIITLRGYKNILDNKFLKYWLQSEQGQYELESRASGTTVFGIKSSVLKKIPISLPPYNEQVAISSVLYSIDEKIDLLHRQNKTLESMAETLFRQWFIEEAKEAWTPGTLKEEFDFVMGQSPSGSSFNEDGIGIPMYQGNADFGFRFPSNRVFTTAPTRFAKPLDTLISVRAPVGAQNMALEKCCIGRGLSAFRFKTNPEFYTYTYFKLRQLMDEIKRFNDEGTVFGSISKSDFEKIEITIPPYDKISSFEDVAKPINDKVIKNCHQIVKLENLRDTLLPKLMSGEVRVQYAEEAIASVA